MQVKLEINPQLYLPRPEGLELAAFASSLIEFPGSLLRAYPHKVIASPNCGTAPTCHPSLTIRQSSTGS